MFVLSVEYLCCRLCVSFTMDFSSILKSKLPDLDIPTDMSLSDFILPQAEALENKIALIDPSSGRSLTFKQLVFAIRRVSRSLMSRGLTKGDVVLVHLPNCVEYVVIVHAVLRLAGVVTTCNPSYTAAELSRQMSDCSPRYIFTTNQFQPVVSAALTGAGLTPKHCFLVGESLEFPNPYHLDDGLHWSPFASLTKSDDVSTEVKVAVSPMTDVAFILYSSGTSGLPKGVMLTHYNMVASVMQCLHADMEVYQDDDMLLAFLPFYHVFGICAFICCSVIKRCSVVIMRQFDLVEYLKLIERYRITLLHMVPPVAVQLAKDPRVDLYDTTSVRECIIGAAPLKQELSMDLQRRLGLKTVKQGYGMTELSPTATLGRPTDWKHGSAGILLPNTQLKIISTDTGEALGAHAHGEVCVRGPQVMLGYLNNPKATRQTIDQQGWLHTGDIGFYDEDHHLYVVDRLKELIKYKGFQVAPAELEALLLTHPSVCDCAVIGVPDDLAGELPKACVVLKKGVECTTDEIHRFINAKASPHKRLRGGIAFMEEIPKSTSGKILRRVLKLQHVEQAVQTASKL